MPDELPYGTGRPFTKRWSVPAARPSEPTCLPREGVDVEPVRDFQVKDRDRRCKPADLHAGCVSADLDLVVAVGAVDDDAVVPRRRP